MEVGGRPCTASSPQSHAEFQSAMVVASTCAPTFMVPASSAIELRLRRIRLSNSRSVVSLQTNLSRRSLKVGETIGYAPSPCSDMILQDGIGGALMDWP